MRFQEERLEGEIVEIIGDDQNLSPELKTLKRIFRRGASNMPLAELQALKTEIRALVSKLR